MGWMGHKSITETLRYVHVAEDHMRPLPEKVIEAAQGEVDPDRKIVRMLGARQQVYGTIAAQLPTMSLPEEESESPNMRKPSVLH
jgi:hypothetical protein